MFYIELAPVHLNWAGEETLRYNPIKNVLAAEDIRRYVGSAEGAIEMAASLGRRFNRDARALTADRRRFLTWVSNPSRKADAPSFIAVAVPI